ncbi:MAG: altronate dehydratase [Lentisphaeria bacterium]|nr:altronate dehydratase [Lentisphaeria bacterium]
MEQTPFLQIHPTDNVAVALMDLQPGFRAGDVVLKDAVGRGHKFAVTAIAAGEMVRKYGAPIGHATQDIAAGEMVHTHNLKTNLDGTEVYTYTPQLPAEAKAAEIPEFMGYRRSDGNVGIRNELWIIPTVGCVNKTAELLAKRYQTTAENVTGPYAFTHPYGCSQLGEDHATTRAILANLVHHPNAAGVLVVALGCENNTLEDFKKEIGDIDPDKVRYMTVQQESDEIAKGMELLAELEKNAARYQREPIPVSELRVGLKCGGSDGLSGITANPLVGAFSDKLIACGGTSVLTEVPEMFGAETLLMERCRNKEVFDRCVEMVNGFKDYFISHGQVVYENPSPGNKAGGISTLEEKSLGCTQKGGTSVVTDVQKYTGRLSQKGLNLTAGPGNDMVAVTALTAAGVHLILFTTGRGTPLGAPAPTVKIATNTALAEFKANWIDFNAGTLVEGESMDSAAERLFRQVIRIANGEETQSEKYGYREIAIFKDGVTL